MMSFTSNILKTRNRAVSGLLRLFILSLLVAASGFTSLQAQVVAYVTPGNFPFSISVIDAANPGQGVLSTIPLRSSTSSVIFSPDGTRAYVSNAVFRNILVIDTASNQIVGTIPIATGPGFFLAISPDGEHLYTDDGCCRVYVVDTETNTVSTTIFVQNANGPIAVTPDGSQVYVNIAGNSFGSTVSVIDTASNTVVADQIPAPFISSSAGGLVFTPDGGHAYVGGFGITVIDTSSHSTTTIPLPFGVSARSIAITPDGSKVFFTTFSFVQGVPSTLGVIRTSDNTIVQQFTFPAQAVLGFGSQIAITPDGAFAWVADNPENLVWIFSTANLSVVNQVPVPHPFTIAISATNPPTAVAGPNQTVRAGQTVQLDGSGSFAPNTAPANLKYAWSIISRPAGSAAALTGAKTATPSFFADAPGDFVVQLIVTDPATGLSSKPSRLTISSLWSPPTADPGPARSVVVGEVVQLNDGGSTDPNGLPLFDFWSLVAQPDGSAAVITQGFGSASFIPDLPGTYIVGLTVFDFFGSSPQATVAITAITRDDFAQLRIHDAINYIAAMPCSHFDACGHRNALSNHLQQAISDIQKGNISQATGKLNDAIIRTDGFPLQGALDGEGPGMDWITDANDQAFVFTALTDAINALTQAPM
jgi:YVTN family beta-propeller protein